MHVCVCVLLYSVCTHSMISTANRLPSLLYQEALLKQQKRREEAMLLHEKKKSQQQGSSNHKSPDAIYSINNTYAKLGW